MHTRLGYDGAVEMRATEIGSIKQSTGQVCPEQGGAFQIGLVEVSISKFGVVKFRPRKLGAMENSFRQIGSSEIRAAEIASFQHRSVKVAPGTVFAFSAQEPLPIRQARRRRSLLGSSRDNRKKAKASQNG